MGGQSVRSFWARRLARDEWLGLHLTLGILLCLALLGCFGLLALAVGGPEPPGIDERIYERLREHREASPATRCFFLYLTDAGTSRFVTPIVLLGAILSIWKRRFAFAAVWVLAITTAPLLNGEVKEVFKRARPAGIDPLAPENSYSFPSGHSMEAIVAYSMVGYLLLVTLPPRRWLRFAVVGVATLLIIAIGFSRMYLSAHWLTDVLGGFALGAAWSAFWIAVLECGRRRSIDRLARSREIATIQT
jgi:undecaprenyl-diphosphatase